MSWDELSRAGLADVLGWAGGQPWRRAMADCAQDGGWHSEGDVWTHTQMVCAQLPGLEGWAALSPHERTVLTFTALFHDSGKPLTSRVDPGTGRITSPKHAAAAVGAIVRLQRHEPAASDPAALDRPLHDQPRSDLVRMPSMASAWIFQDSAE